MATMKTLGLWTHLRAETHQHVLHYRKGRLVREGAGLAYWFNPLSAAIAQLPVEDCETTFLLNERTRDLQEVAIQVTLRYRFADPKRAAERFNFGISLATGRWDEKPLERVSSLWAERAQIPSRRYLSTVDLEEAVRDGAESIRTSILGALESDPDLDAMGLFVASVQVIGVSPARDLEKALQTPTRESIQQRADEAVFQRRALAVEKERAIQENELSTEIELARRKEQLISRHGENDLREAQLAAQTELARTEANLEREALAAEAHARNETRKAEGEAEATRLRDRATAEGEAQKVAVWSQASGKVLFGLALQEFAGHIDNIQHLSLTPELFGDGLRQLLLSEAEK